MIHQQGKLLQVPSIIYRWQLTMIDEMNTFKFTGAAIDNRFCVAFASALCLLDLLRIN